MALAAWQAVPMDRTVHLSMGEFPASEYAMQMFTEYLIHGWDLAVSVGARADLPADLVAACAAWFDGVQDLYEGHVTPVEDTAAVRTPQTALLAQFGRSQGQWSV